MRLHRTKVMDTSEGFAPSAAPASIRQRRVLTWSVAMAVSWSFMLTLAGPSSAAPGTQVDVEPEVLSAQVGQTVTLTATVRDADGNPATGPGSETHIRWLFLPGSPNDIDSPGNSPDLECWTGEVGTCAVTYVAAATGTDAICARAGGPVTMCDEPVDAPDWGDSADVVQRVITTDPVPTPTPTPDPTPTPTPDPTPTPTPDPTPTTTPTPDPTPTPSPDPTPTPTPDPTPSPTPDPTPSPTPDPTPAPTPAPNTVPPPPAPESTPAPTPTPEPVRVIDPAETPMPSPEPTESPSPTPSPTPEPTATPAQESTATTPPSPPAPEPAPAPAPAAAQPAGPGAVVVQVLSAAAAQVSRVVRPEVAAAIATEFGFPMLLTVAVLAFLMIQNHVDRRDPKLRMAPRHAYETYLKFETEEQL